MDVRGFWDFCSPKKDSKWSNSGAAHSHFSPGASAPKRATAAGEYQEQNEAARSGVVTALTACCCLHAWFRNLILLFIFHSKLESADFFCFFFEYYILRDVKKKLHKQNPINSPAGICSTSAICGSINFQRNNTDRKYWKKSDDWGLLTTCTFNLTESERRCIL